MNNEQIWHKLLHWLNTPVFGEWLLKHVVGVVVVLFVLLALFRRVMVAKKSREALKPHEVECRKCGWVGAAQFSTQRCPKCGKNDYRRPS